MYADFTKDVEQAQHATVVMHPSGTLANNFESSTVNVSGSCKRFRLTLQLSARELRFRAGWASIPVGNNTDVV